MKRIHKILIGICVGIILISNVLLVWKTKGGLNVEKPDEMESVLMTLSISDLLGNDGLDLKGLYLRDILSHEVIDSDELFNDSIDRILVCRISQLYCESCITYAIEKAISVKNDSIIDMPLVIMGSYENDLSLKIIRDSHSKCDSLKYYNTPELNLPIEEHGYPYFMVVDSDLKVSDVFTPNKSYPEFTDRYFRFVSNKWNSR